MNSDALREALSRYFDGELSPDERAELEQRLASSEGARGYLTQLQVLRRHLRYEPADASPDVTGRVLAAIQPKPRRPARSLRIAAAFVAGVIGGAVFIGLALRRPTPVAAADIPDLVLDAQNQVTSMTARLHVVERGWHPDLPERTFSGSITYRAPESLWVELRDDTAYPSADWVPNHTTVVVDDNAEWSRSVAGCPTEALPNCTPAEPRLLAVSDREPFPDASPAPLDLIVPVAGFSRAAEPGLVGFRDLDGRRAVGVEVTAAQVVSLLNGFTATGNWRDVHPTDRVELWLDRDALVPLAFSVFATDTPDRRLWAIRHGYTDQPGIPILDVTLSEVSLNVAAPVDFPPIPQYASIFDAGFRDGLPSDLEALTPEHLSNEMTLHRTGILEPRSGPSVSVATWSDGRAWLKVRWTADWQASRLFGDLGTLVRQVPLGSGVAYLNERGDRVGLHSSGIDLVVLGSLPTETLLEVAESLEITGRQVPENWAEAATSTLDEARAAVDGFLVPVDLEGFGVPAVRVDTGTATLAYAGPGNRAFLLSEAVDGELSPPLEANVRGVTVRRVEGRYSPDRGLLEWVEGNLTISLASTTLSLDELVAIADAMGKP